MYFSIVEKNELEKAHKMSKITKTSPAMEVMGQRAPLLNACTVLTTSAFSYPFLL